MKKFMALYMAPASALEQMMKATPEEQKAGMDTWIKWGKEHEAVLADLGTPLGKTKKVTTEGITDMKNDLTGYSIVKADSLEEAAKIFQSSPHLMMGTGTWIEVVDCVELPGM